MLLDILNTVESLADCRHVFSDRGLAAECPSCQEALDIRKHGVVCPNSDCDFFAGGITDIIPDYQQFILGAYAERHPALAAINWPGLAVAAQSQRALFQFFLRLFQSRETTLLQAQFHRWLEKKGVSANDRLPGWYPLEPKQLMALVDLLTAAGAKMPPHLDISQPAAVIPFWGDFHALAGVRFIASDNRDWGMAHVRSFRYSWSNLWNRGPCFHEDIVTAARRGHQALHFNSEAAYYAPYSLERAYLPEAQAGLAEMRIRGVGDLAARQNIRVCSPVPHDTTVETWPQFVTRRVHEELRSPCASLDDVQHFIDESGLSRCERAALAESLESAGHVTDAKDLATACLSTVVLQDERWKLLETPFAYRAGKPQGLLKEISNFTWAPESLVLFDDSPPWIRGTYRSRDLVREIQAQPRDLDSPSAFEGCLKKSLPPSVTPTIYDRAAFQPLLEIWRRQTDQLPRHTGFSYLGWSHDRKTFHLPGTVLRGQKATPVQHLIWHPAAEPLHRHSPMDYRPVAAPELTANEKFLISVLAGNMSRVFRHERPVPVVFQREASDPLTFLFQVACGQSEPITPAPNFRGTRDVLFSGYPVLLHPVSLSTMDALQWTAWILGDDASLTSRHYTPAMVTPEFAQYFRWMLRVLPEKLMSILPPPPPPSVDALSSMLNEGGRLLGWEFLHPYPGIDALFLPISSEQLRDFATLDYVQHVVRLKAPYDEALILEGAMLCSREVVWENGCYVFPETAAVKFLTQFYGFLPKMKLA